MSDDPARSLSGLRILVLDQDRSRGDALSALLREAGAEAGTVPEGVEPAVVIAEAVPDGIVIDRASPALDPIKLRATLESDTFLRSIVIVPGVLGEAMRDGAMALKRLVTVRLAARLALAKNLESGNEAEGSVTDVGPSAIVRLAARAPYPARVEVTVGPRQITVSTADGLLLGVTEAAGGKVTQRGLDALAALLASDGGKFRISKETKGPIGNLVGEPDEHLRNAAAMSRRTTTRPPPAGAPITVPKVGGARLPEPTRPTAPGPAVPGPSPGGAVPRPASSPVAPPASPRAVVALSDNPRPLGRTLLGVPAQGSDAPPAPGRSASAPAGPITIPRPPEPAPQTAAEPSDGLPVPREPLPVAARPGGPVRSKTLLGIAAPTLPGRATVGGPPAPTATPALDPITSKVETPAEVLVRSKPAELDDDVATDRLEKRAPRAPLPGPSATELEESETLLADRSALSDSGSDMPTAIGPRPDVVAMMAEALEPSAAAAAGAEPRAASPSVVPVRNIVIDEAVTVPRSRALPETEPAAPKVVPGFDAEAPTVPRAARQPESESAASIR
ncbi:MAG: hypothetical protein IT379_14185, partial [Deltaproteobacteria bacterium]|nr:hypothetical protein [Deltaproteobacteria bacterium]